MQDKLLAHLGASRTFLEVGANDGFTQSNTYWLERFHDWRGVLVEPIPSLYREAVRERPRAKVFNCALVGDGTTTSVTLRYADLMSIVAGARGSDEADEQWVHAARNPWDHETYEVEVPARTISSVLDEAGLGRIDVLCLDVEGYEVEVLRGLDLTRHAPGHLLVEVRDDEARAAVEQAIAGEYVAVEALSPFDVLYRRAGSADRRSTD